MKAPEIKFTIYAKRLFVLVVGTKNVICLVFVYSVSASARQALMVLAIEA